MTTRPRHDAVVEDEWIGQHSHYFEFDYGCNTCHQLYCQTVNAFGYCHMPPPNAGVDGGMGCPNP
jgi:hypothetical protein